MKGRVDASMRALLAVIVAATEDGPRDTVLAWIDTAFNGGLVMPRANIERLGLRQASTTQAILADGSSVVLETFTCYLDWFGSRFRTQVVANGGEFPLLGTLLLADRMLTVDYKTKTVALV